MAPSAHSYQTVLDCAAVDGNAPPGIGAARAAGAAGIYLKKSQHLTRDRFYEREAQRARDAGLVVGAYLFPWFSVQAQPPKTQVAAFKNAPGEIVRGTDLPPALDVECPGGFRALGRPLTGIVEVIRQLVLEIENQVGCTPVVYTSYNQWYDLGLPAAPWAARCPLWIKTAYRLQPGRPVDTVQPPEPHTGHNQASDPRGYYRIPDPWAASGWWLQQYQGDAVGWPGFSRTVDISRFHILQPDDHGPHVAWLARKLGRDSTSPYRGSTPVDTYNEDLTLAVTSIQRSRAIAANSVVDLRTFSAIAWT